MEPTDDLISLLRANEGKAWTREEAATEEEIVETEKGLHLRLDHDYRKFLLYSNGGRLSGGKAWISFDPVRDVLEFNDGSYYPELSKMVVFGGDDGDFIYYMDPEGLFGKGRGAVFMVEKGCQDRESSMYLAPDLRRFVDRVIAGDSFSDVPYLGKNGGA